MCDCMLAPFQSQGESTNASSLVINDRNYLVFCLWDIVYSSGLPPFRFVALLSLALDIPACLGFVVLLRLSLTRLCASALLRLWVLQEHLGKTWYRCGKSFWKKSRG